jgi:peptidoglycan/xylan/chitin deacetylase (PgdA/CDA1 family)
MVGLCTPRETPPSEELRMKNVRRIHVLVGALTLAATIATISASPAAASSHKRACRNGYVSLSYDDGPTTSTPALLRALERAELRVTFFDVGERAEAFPSYVTSQHRAGHAVANHSYDHADLTTLPDSGYEQFARTQAILTPLAGSAPTFYRPPYGATSPEVRAAAARLSLTEVSWTVDTNDWASPSTNAIVSAALSVRAGGFVLMHDGYPNTLAAVPKIAAGLASRGLCAGRIVPSSTPTNAWEGLDFPAAVAAW